MQNELINLGDSIRTLRIESGLSQERLSEVSGVERSQISKIESGQINGVQYSTIHKIFESLGFVLVPSKYKNLNLKPFVKWAGGKTQLLDFLVNKMPKDYKTYYEPFVGGGALLFKVKPNNFVINDVNSELIKAYRCFKNKKSYNALIKLLVHHQENHSEEYFYKMRELDKSPEYKNFSNEEVAARMIYLNKSCFNGLYRVNSQGFFNVPFGKKTTVNCFDKSNYDSIYSYFKNSNSKIFNGDYKSVIKNAQSRDFVYFDPPYDVLDNKNSFTSYDKNSFGKKEQYELYKVFKELTKKGVFVMLSNHNTNYINELYKEFNITVVPARRMINSKSSGRGNVEEVVITNY